MAAIVLFSDEVIVLSPFLLVFELYDSPAQQEL